MFLQAKVKVHFLIAWLPVHQKVESGEGLFSKGGPRIIALVIPLGEGAGLSDCFIQSGMGATARVAKWQIGWYEVGPIVSMV